MFDRSWISPSLLEFIEERVLKRIPLHRLAPNGSKNLRDSWPTEADRQRLAAMAAMAMADEPQTMEPAYKQNWNGQEPWIPPPFETSATASTLPANTPLESILPSNTTTSIVSQEPPFPSATTHHPDPQNRPTRPETWITIDSIFSATSSNSNSSTPFAPDLVIPVRLLNLSQSTDWPNHTLLLINSTFLTNLTSLLRLRKTHAQAQRSAALIKTATEPFVLKLKSEIARTEIRLRRLSPEVRLAKQYDVFENATSGPSATALKLERRLRELKSFLERTEERVADICVALELQGERLRAAQEAVNDDLERALGEAGLLGGEVGEPEVGVKVEDVIGEYRAFCRRNGIKWDGGEGGKLPESLRVGPVGGETG